MINVYVFICYTHTYSNIHLTLALLGCNMDRVEYFDPEEHAASRRPRFAHIGRKSMTFQKPQLRVLGIRTTTGTKRS